MLSYRLGTVNDFHWGFKPVSAIANLTLIQHLLEKIKKNQLCINTLYLVHIEHKDKNVKKKRT